MLLVKDLHTLNLGPVSLEVGPADSISIHGPSGSGKTQLLRAIADLDPHEGKVRIFDTEQNKVSGPHWRKMAGYLPADTAFWEENALLHFMPEDHEAVKQRANQLGLPDDILQKSLNKLSSGEKQRLALIRLLINEPRALLLDESTSHLDPETKEMAERMIQQYQQQNLCPVIWVSHDKQQRERVAGRHYRMQNGRLSEMSP